MGRYFHLLFMAVFIVHCAATTEMNSSKGSRYVITLEEIQGCSGTTALEVIQLLRPELLDKAQRRINIMGSMRDGGVSPDVMVYVNGIRYGGKESLETIAAEQIGEIMYLNPSEATGRFGSNHAGGAFLITIKK